MKTFIIRYCLMACIFAAISACSIKFEVGYHGETAIDDKTYTDKAAKPVRY